MMLSIARLARLELASFIYIVEPSRCEPSVIPATCLFASVKTHTHSCCAHSRTLTLLL
jgi:hypothetical protein